MSLRAIAMLGVVALFAAAAGAYFSLAKSRDAANTLFTRGATPKPLPQLVFEDIAGKRHSIADFKGKVVLLNLWATWCAPCREEMPALDRLQAQLGGPRFEVVAVSVDQQAPALARKFLDEAGVKSLALYVDPTGQASFKLNAVGLPATLLIDREGREIGRRLGAVKWDSPQIVDTLRGRIDEENRH